MWVNFIERIVFLSNTSQTTTASFSGGTPDFKWRGLSNGGENQNPQKSPGVSNKINPFLDQKLTPQESHACMPNFRALVALYSQSLVALYSQSSVPGIFETPVLFRCNNGSNKKKTSKPGFWLKGNFVEDWVNSRWH